MNAPPNYSLSQNHCKLFQTIPVLEVETSAACQEESRRERNMQPTRKATRVYIRLQPSTGSEISVRKRKQTFVLFIDNTETQEFTTQQEAMQAADRMADSNRLIHIRID